MSDIPAATLQESPDIAPDYLNIATSIHTISVSPSIQVLRNNCLDPL